MSYLSPIQQCNNYQLDQFIPWIIDQHVLGWINQAFAQQLERWNEIFIITDQSVQFVPALASFSQRTQALIPIIWQLHQEGHIERYHNENYPVSLPAQRQQAYLLIDRGAAPYFGITAFGQHINGYVRTSKGIKLWIAKRSQNRWYYPGKLDNMVAGGCPYELSLTENLYKECMEEASIPLSLAQQVTPVSALTYCRETEKGLRSDILYCYDLALPDDFIPQTNDDEVECFYLWEIEKVAQLVESSNQFKLNCNLVIIDFLIRHGIITPEHPDYIDIQVQLHPNPTHPTPELI